MPLDLPINYANESLPAVSDELIIWLREVYPDRMPERDVDLETIRFRQGQISVVKTLISVNEELRGNVLR
mgnify:CR=1 FL=1|tara:strand:+ start:45 stop:254 length:210 start_codon:yes stop_codon:yes gene_type:complete